MQLQKQNEVLLDEISKIERVQQSKQNTGENDPSTAFASSWSSGLSTQDAKSGNLARQTILLEKRIDIYRKEIEDQADMHKKIVAQLKAKLQRQDNGTHGNANTASSTLLHDGNCFGEYEGYCSEVIVSLKKEILEAREKYRADTIILFETLNNLTTENESLKSRLISDDQHNRELLSKRADNIDNLNAVVHSDDAHLEEIRHLTDQLAIKQEACHRHDQEFERLYIEKSSIEDAARKLYSENIEFQERYALDEAEIVKLKAALASDLCQVDTHRIDELEAKIDGLNKQNIALNEDLEINNSKCLEYQVTIRNLESSLDMLKFAPPKPSDGNNGKSCKKNACNETRQVLVEMTSAYDSLKSEYDNLLSENTNISLDKLKEKYDNLVTTTSKLSDENISAHERLLMAEKESEELKRVVLEYESKSKIMNDLRSESEVRLIQVKELSQRLVEVEEKKNSLEAAYLEGNQRIKQLEAELDLVKRENTLLNQSNSVTLGDNRSLSSTLTSTQEEIVQLKLELKNMQQIVENSSVKSKQIEEISDDCTDETPGRDLLTESESESRLREIIVDCEKTIAYLREEIRQKEVDLTILQQDLEASTINQQKSVEGIEYLESEKLDLIEAMAAKEKSLKNISKELELMTLKARELTSEVEAIKILQFSIDLENENLKHTSSTPLGQHNKMNCENGSLEMKLASSRDNELQSQQIYEQVTQSEVEASLNSQLQISNDMYTNLTQKYDDLSFTLKDAEKRISILQRDIAEKVEESEKHYKVSALAQQECESLQLEIFNAQTDKKYALQEHEKVLGDNNALKQALLQKDDLIGQLNSSLETDAKNTILISQLKASEDKCAILTQKCDDLSSTIQDAERRISILQFEIAKKDEEYKKQYDILSLTQQECEKLRLSNKNSHEDKKFMSMQHEKLQEELKAMENVLLEKDELLGQLNSEYKELELQLQTSTSSLAEKDHYVSKLLDDMAKKTAENDALKMKFDEISKDCSTLEEECISMTLESDSLLHGTPQGSTPMELLGANISHPTKWLEGPIKSVPEINPSKNVNVINNFQLPDSIEQKALPGKTNDKPMHLNDIYHETNAIQETQHNHVSAINDSEFNEYSLLQTENEELKLECENLNAIISILKRQVNDMTQTSMSSVTAVQSSVQATLNNLSSKYVAICEEKANLQEKVRFRNRERRSLAHEVEIKEHESTSLASELTRIHVELDNMTQSLESSRNKQRETEASMSTLQDSLKKSNSQIQISRTELEECNTRYNKTKENMADLQTQHDTLSDDHATLKRKYQDSLKNYNLLMNDKISLEERLAMEHEEIVALSADLEVKSAAVNHLEQVCKLMESRLKAVDQVTHDTSRLTNELILTTQQIHGLESKSDEYNDDYSQSQNMSLNHNTDSVSFDTNDIEPLANSCSLEEHNSLQLENETLSIERDNLQQMITILKRHIDDISNDKSAINCTCSLDVSALKQEIQRMEETTLQSNEVVEYLRKLGSSIGLTIKWDERQLNNTEILKISIKQLYDHLLRLLHPVDTSFNQKSGVGVHPDAQANEECMSWIGSEELNSSSSEAQLPILGNHRPRTESNSSSILSDVSYTEDQFVSEDYQSDNSWLRVINESIDLNEHAQYLTDQVSRYNSSLDANILSVTYEFSIIQNPKNSRFQLFVPVSFSRIKNSMEFKNSSKGDFDTRL